MLVFYYQWPDGRTHCVCVPGSLYPGRLSPIWDNPNTSIAMVPGTENETDDEVLHEPLP